MMIDFFKYPVKKECKYNGNSTIFFTGDSQILHLTANRFIMKNINYSQCIYDSFHQLVLVMQV